MPAIAYPSARRGSEPVVAASRSTRPGCVTNAATKQEGTTTSHGSVSANDSSPQAPIAVSRAATQAPIPNET